MATVDAMKVANKEMKKQYKGIDIDKIEVSYHFRPVASSCESRRGRVRQADFIARVSTTIWRT
jgi:hypothetical protein